MASYHRLELMMFYGSPGAGKTTAAMEIARANPDAMFHYLEADRRLDPVFEWWKDWQGDNVMRYPAFEYDDMIKSCATVRENLRTVIDPWNHWVVVDTIGHCYREIQNTFSLKTYHVTMEELKERRMVKPEKGATFDNLHGWEWAIVKRIFYNEFVWPLVRYSSNNVILIAHARSLGERFSPQSPAEYTERFDRIKQVPDVHKDVIRYLDTVLYFSNIDANFAFQTMKETGRRNWMNEPTPFADFWQTYQSSVLSA